MLPVRAHHQVETALITSGEADSDTVGVLVKCRCPVAEEVLGAVLRRVVENLGEVALEDLGLGDQSVAVELVRA